MKAIYFLILSLVFSGCASVSEVTSPMRHMKACHYNFFAPIAEAKYYDLTRQGYNHREARDSTIRYTGRVQLNVSYDFLEQCVCKPWNCDAYYEANPNNHTKKQWNE